MTDPIKLAMEINHFESKAKFVLEELITFYLHNPTDNLSRDFHSLIQRMAFKKLDVNMIYTLERLHE